MAKNVSTFSAKFVIDDSGIDQTMGRLKGAVARGATEIADKLATPVKAIEREIELFGNKLSKTLDLLRTGSATPKLLQDLKQASEFVDLMASKLRGLSSTGSPISGISNVFSKLSLVNQATQTGQRLASPSGVIPTSQGGSYFIPSRESYVGVPAGFQSFRDIRQDQFIQDNWRDRQRAAAHRSMGYDTGLTTQYPSIDADEQRARVAANTSAYRNFNVVASSERAARDARNNPPDPVGPYGPFLSERDRDFANRQAHAARFMDAYQHRQASTRFEQIRGYEGHFAQQRTVERQRQAATDLTAQYTREAEVIDRLTKKYAALSAEQQKSLGIHLRAKTDAGMNMGLQNQAFNAATNPFSPNNPNNKFGRGSWMHSLNFGTQNLAFGIEDYLISSQYGGYRAGMRAVTNNMTAIAAAATGSMNPLVGAGIITGAAITGFAAPYAIDALYNMDDKRDKMDDLLFGAKSKARDQLIASRYGMQNSRTGSLLSQKTALSQELGAYHERQKDREERSAGLNQQSLNYEPFWFERAGANLLSSVGYSGISDRIKLYDSQARERQRIKTEELADLSPQAAADKAAAFKDFNLRLKQERGMDEQTRKLQARHVEERSGEAIQGMYGELVNPKLEYERYREDVSLRRKHIRERNSNNPELMQEELANLDFESGVRYDEHQVDLANYKKQLKDRDWQHRSRLIDFETSPVSAAKQRHQLQREKIEQNEFFTDGQRQEQLAALEKQHKREMRHINDPYPELGNAIDVGSAEDVRLRQKYFSRETEREKESDKHLAELVKEVKALRMDLKGRTKVVTVRK